MSPQAVDFQVEHNGRRAGGWTGQANPGDSAFLTRAGRDWLRSNGWHDTGRWREFELIVFRAGTSERLGNVRLG